MNDRPPPGMMLGRSTSPKLGIRKLLAAAAALFKLGDKEGGMMYAGFAQREKGRHRSGKHHGRTLGAFGRPNAKWQRGQLSG